MKITNRSEGPHSPPDRCSPASAALSRWFSRRILSFTHSLYLYAVMFGLSPLLAWPQVVGQGTAMQKITLPEAIDRAETNYPKLRAALEQQTAAGAAIGVARTAYLPRVDLLWQTNRATANNIFGLLLPQAVIPSISGPVIPADNTRSAWASAGGTLLSWQPFDFGLRQAQVTVARQGEAVAKAGTQLSRLDVALATANAYIELTAAKQLALIAQANLERLQTFAKSVHVLVDNQLRPGADASQADAGVAFARTQLIQARTNIQVRRATLANLIGIPATSIELDDAQLLESATEDSGEPLAIEAHPAAQQEAALVDQQRARLSALRHSYVPQFSVQAAISGRGTGAAMDGNFPGGTTGLVPNTLNWATGIQVTFPLFDYFSLREQKKVQEANVRAEQALYNQTRDDLSTQVQQARAQLEGARQVAQNTPTELGAARQSETQQRARFKAGLATVIDVSAAESVLVQAEADDAIARINVWRSLANEAGARGDLTTFLNQLLRKP